jgi:hypothetical protein
MPQPPKDTNKMFFGDSNKLTNKNRWINNKCPWYLNYLKEGNNCLLMAIDIFENIQRHANNQIN